MMRFELAQIFGNDRVQVTLFVSLQPAPDQGEWVRYRDAEQVVQERDRAVQERDTLARRVAWQPIETFPHDEPDVLVLHPDGSICLSYWGSIRGVFGIKSKIHASVCGGEGDFCRDGVGWMRPWPDPPVVGGTGG